MPPPPAAAAKTTESLQVFFVLFFKPVPVVDVIKSIIRAQRSLPVTESRLRYLLDFYLRHRFAFGFRFFLSLLFERFS